MRFSAREIALNHAKLFIFCWPIDLFNNAGDPGVAVWLARWASDFALMLESAEGFWGQVEIGREFLLRDEVEQIGMLAQTRTQLQSVQLGENQLEDNDLRLHLLDQLQSGNTICGSTDLIASAFQISPAGFQQAFVEIDQRNFCGHWDRPKCGVLRGTEGNITSDCGF